MGTDILPAATHLTTSVLSSAYPTESFTDTQIITLKYGEKPDNEGNKDIFIGALDLIIQEERILPLLRTRQEHHSGISENIMKPIDMPHASFDLVIMNPPFVKPTNHAGARKDTRIPTFAAFGISKIVQSKMAKKLAMLSRKRGKLKVGNGYAGLPTNFMDLADVKIKEGGVLALIIPATFASGSSWKAMRSLIEERYENIAVVSIAAPSSELRSFSADTKMAEILVIATRKRSSAKEKSSVSYYNFTNGPNSIYEAIEFARIVTSTSANENGVSLKLGTEQSCGHCIQSKTGFSNVNGPPGVVSIQDRDISKMAIELAKGAWHIPFVGKVEGLPLTRLGALGNTCCGDRSISNLFTKEELQSGVAPTFPMLWKHDAPSGRESQLIVEPDHKGDKRPGKLDEAQELWNKNATRLCFNSSFRMNSQQLGACLSPKPLLGGRAWRGFKCHDLRHEIPLVLWMNTTLGLISFWCLGTRQQNGRSIVTVSMLSDLAVMNPQGLTDNQLSKAKNIFQTFAQKKFLSAHEAWKDKTRIELDERVLFDMLGLTAKNREPLHLLREKWCLEPTVHGGQDEEDEEDEDGAV